MKNNIYLSISIFILTFFTTLTAAPLSFTTSATNVSCNGGTNGIITITASNGVPPYLYSVDGGLTTSTSNVFTGLGAGVYAVLVKDAANATTSVKKVTLTQPTAVSFTTSLLNPTCYAGTNGRIYFVGSGGVSPYNFSINGGATWLTSNNVTQLGAGTYTCLVRDSRLCQSASVVITLTQPSRLSATATATDETCFGTRDGSINITASGGVSPYSYTINSGVTYSSASAYFNLPSSSNYIYRVRDANNCLSTLQGVTVGTPDPVSITFATRDAICYGDSNGEISANALGGHHDFEYSIDGGITYLPQDTFKHIPAGSYTIIARDQEGCTSLPNVALINQGAPITVDAATSLYACGGGVSGGSASDGSITLAVSGGAGGFQYLWSNGAVTANLSNLTAGNYAVTAVDQHGCAASGNWTLVATPAINLTLSHKIYAGNYGVSCNGSVDGEVYSQVSGGCGPYTYSWSTGQTTINLASVPTGLYELTVTDQNGQQAVAMEFLDEPQPLELDYQVGEVSCYGQNDGTLDVQGYNGTAPYTFSIDNGSSWQANSHFDGMSYVNNPYQMMVQDANGCRSDFVYVIYQTPAPVGISVTTRDPNNASASNGKITITSSGSGNQYSIDGGVTFSGNNIFNSLGAGMYQVVVKGAGGCWSDMMNVELIAGSSKVGSSKSDTQTEAAPQNLDVEADDLPQMEEFTSGNNVTIVLNYPRRRPEIISIRVTDLLGRQIENKTVHLEGNSFSLTVSGDLVSGHIICVSVNDDNGWSSFKKVYIP